MIFDLRAAKAYAGGIMAGAAVPLAHFIVGLVHAGTGFDIPASLESTLATGLGMAFGWITVYLVPNKPATPATP